MKITLIVEAGLTLQFISIGKSGQIASSNLEKECFEIEWQMTLGRVGLGTS